MEKYEVIVSKSWKNHKTGATASIYGACPWTNAADEPNWSVVTCGWTLRNNRNETVGIGRLPFATKELAVEHANKLNAR